MLARFLLALIVFTALASPALAWGAAGHAIVATIAQSLLHPAVRSHLCTILPDFTSYTSPYPREGAPHKHCHLATLASWPDTAKWRMPWSGHLHYINGLGDNPPLECAFGSHGWASEENVLTAMVNYTRQLKETRDEQRDVALRFVTHLVGDAHQPLHLTGRARGGNDIMVRYEGRQARLHSVWDGQILNTQLRNLANYTTPLPSAPVESALQGRVYDNYIRWVLAEGLGITLSKQPSPPVAAGWWQDEWEHWAECPDTVGHHDFNGSPTDRVDETDLPLCPMAWTKPMHPLVCSYAFAAPVPPPAADKTQHHGVLRDAQSLQGDDSMSWLWSSRRRRRRRGGRRGRRPYPPTTPPNGGHDGDAGDLPQHPAPPHPTLPELSGPDYLGRIDADKVIQKQLAMGGIRLAAILNSVLLEEALEAQAHDGKTSTAAAPAKIYTEEEGVLSGTTMIAWQQAARSAYRRVRNVAAAHLAAWGL